jgi:hypothetical protein
MICEGCNHATYCSVDCQEKNKMYHELICSPTVPEMIVKRMKLQLKNEISDYNPFIVGEICLSVNSYYLTNISNSPTRSNLRIGHITNYQYAYICIECYKPLTTGKPFSDFILRFKTEDNIPITMYQCIPCEDQGNSICTIHIQAKPICLLNKKKEHLSFITFLDCLKKSQISCPRDTLKIIWDMNRPNKECKYV